MTILELREKRNKAWERDNTFTAVTAEVCHSSFARYCFIEITQGRRCLPRGQPCFDFHNF